MLMLEVDVFAALASPIRREILVQLRKGPRKVGDFGEQVRRRSPGRPEHLQVFTQGAAGTRRAKRTRALRSPRSSPARGSRKVDRRLRTLSGKVDSMISSNCSTKRTHDERHWNHSPRTFLYARPRAALALPSPIARRPLVGEGDARAEVGHRSQMDMGPWGHATLRSTGRRTRAPLSISIRRVDPEYYYHVGVYPRGLGLAWCSPTKGLTSIHRWGAAPSRDEARLAGHPRKNRLHDRIVADSVPRRLNKRPTGRLHAKAGTRVA